MFSGEELKNHLETSSTIKINSAIVGEWNMNVLSNISMVGNYRYRPEERYIAYYEIGNYPEFGKYSIIPSTFDPVDAGNFYTGATDADVKIDAGIDNNDEPILLQATKTKERLLYSLEDCFGKFRPRSGINKVRFFGTQFDRFLGFENENMSLRPRYYVSSDTDAFKYWTSYRTENGREFGISKHRYRYYNPDRTAAYPYGRGLGGPYYMSDAAPFVVYKEQVPANRLVVKMQTHVGSYQVPDFFDYGTFFHGSDPAYGDSNARVPIKWRIEYLSNNQWITATSFDDNSKRKDGSSVIKSDGYVEISYGLKVPTQYENIFVHAGTISSELARPIASIDGYAYLIKTSDTDLGIYHIWNNGQYQTFTPEYGWQLVEESIDSNTSLVKDTTSPDIFIDPTNATYSKHREFQYIQGIRIVVDSVNRADTTFDLIEMSPKLVVDLTEKTSQFSIVKAASDLGETGLPVGQLLASTGDLSLFDYDQAFLDTNSNSLISNYLTNNFQVKIYEVISEVNGSDYYVPIKTMYSEGFPSINNADRSVSISLRDRFLQFESQTAPQLFMRDISLSYAISILLDSIGFSNYIFKRNPNEKELNIPFFFIAPNTTVAQVLTQLAVSAQAAMFFDEYNNFVVMSKGYLMPSADERGTDIILYGSNDFQKNSIINNEPTSTQLSNIIEIASTENQIFNDGKITYSSRAIQRSYSGIDNADRLDVDKKWVYKPVLLWEVSATESLRNTTGETETQAGYALSAIPLNTDLSSSVPSVVNNQLVNNTMDLGESIYSLARYSGYLYANGEIIRYDAMQYNVIGSNVSGSSLGTNNIWISSAAEYYSYFSKLPFGGKMYPTGLVRIFSEPQYEVVAGTTVLKNGEVLKHGRGQFNTPVVQHGAGLNSYWTANTSVTGRSMKSKFLFENSEIIVLSNVNMPSGATTVNVTDASKIKVGYFVKLVSSASTGALSTLGETTISAVSGNTITFDKAVSAALVGATLNVYFKMTTNGLTGNLYKPTENNLAYTSSRTGIIKNLLTSENIEDSAVNKLTQTKAGTVQSSALVVTGPSFPATQSPRDFITSIFKPLGTASSPSSYRHFGTRVRLIGKTATNGAAGAQIPVGNSPFLTANRTVASSTDTASNQINIGSSSAGISILLNSATGVGYYFEILALTATKLSGYEANGNLHNVFFYKLVNETVGLDTAQAMPVKLWSDFASILVDDGTLIGQSRVVGEQNPTVYDLAVEYEDVAGIRKFYLYINDVRIAVVEDTLPLPAYNDMAMFVRGSSRAMFENIFAIGNNYNKNYNYAINTPISSTFSGDSISANNSFRKYAMSGAVQSSYLSGISPGDVPQYNMYFEEFGTIMREMSHFKVKYDKAYPALYSQILPTFSKIKGYVVSGYTPDAYGAEFLVFNASDSTLVLDDDSQNYLRISGITFTGESNNELTVDSYFSERAKASDPVYANNDIISPTKEDAYYNDIKRSRSMYGRKEFNISTPFIQSEDSAKELLGWISSKVMRTKKSVGIKIFANPMIQLGDIVSIDYQSKDGIDQIKPQESRFVVYNISYSRGTDGPEMIIYLSEVV